MDLNVSKQDMLPSFTVLEQVQKLPALFVRQNLRVNHNGYIEKRQGMLKVNFNRVPVTCITGFHARSKCGEGIEKRLLCVMSQRYLCKL